VFTAPATNPLNWNTIYNFGFDANFAPGNTVCQIDEARLGGSGVRGGEARDLNAANHIVGTMAGVSGTIPAFTRPFYWDCATGLSDLGSLGGALTLLAEWQHRPERRWACPRCHEIVEGPFDLCWNCGAPAPQ